MQKDNSSALKDRLDRYYAVIKPKLDSCRLERQKLDRSEATRFTVFDYVDPDENRLSDILHGLLDPLGSHGQGSAFLSSFLTELGLQKLAVNRSCRVKREDRTCADRRIDIIIELDGFCIGIENKPFACEGDEQLSDYRKYLQQRYKGEYMLVYLPGNGSAPISLQKSELAVLQAAGKFRSLAYRTDLLRWLERCCEDCKADKVRWFLRDFAAYVQRTFELSDVDEESSI
jgi:hypothetical protein